MISLHVTYQGLKHSQKYGPDTDPESSTVGVYNEGTNCVLCILEAGIANSHIMQLSKGNSFLNKKRETSEKLYFHHVSLVKLILHPFTMANESLPWMNYLISCLQEYPRTPEI